MTFQDVRTLLEFRSGLYLDSLTLLRLSQRLAAIPGVRDALVAMATPLNLEMAAGLGFEVPAECSPNDLMVALRTDNDAALAAARLSLDAGLGGGGPALGHGAAGTPGVPPPRTTGTAVTRSRAQLAVISVPGSGAFAEAMDALRAGASVLVFSDNVPVSAEMRLKDEAAARDLLMMGPDCGTAILSGLGLGFANVARRGSLGVVAASGTGAQQLISLLDAAGVGISHCVGVGGRDLTGDVGGRSSMQALSLLDNDPGTELIVVVSKPPDAVVAGRIREFADRLATPVILALLGPGEPDLSAVARMVAARLGRPVPGWPSRPGSGAAAPVPGLLRGLFSGGTLCTEALLIASPMLGPVLSNVASGARWRPGGGAAGRHLMIDFGDDAFTRGRPHPMIDYSLRLQRIMADAADPAVSVMLLDVVLGYGAHPDPAAELVPAIRSARSAAASREAELAVVVALVGTQADPQGLARQTAALADAGAHVFVSNAEAARASAALALGDATLGGVTLGGLAADSGGPPADALTAALPGAGVGVVAAGLHVLSDALRGQGASVTDVDWRPPVGGTAAGLAIVLADQRAEHASRLAVERMLAAQALLIEVGTARDLLGLQVGQFLHAGPPIGWDRASGPLRGALIGAAMFEGIAATPQQAEAWLAAGHADLSPCHDHGAVGPMAGVISPSMWVFKLADPSSGGTAFCSLNEGLGRVLRYGAYGDDVLSRLRWMSGRLGPALRDAVRHQGSVDIRAIIGSMLHMGDEGHNRNRAGTLLFMRELGPHLAEIVSGTNLAEIMRFVLSNDHFFLNLSMPASKLAADAARDQPGATLVVALARNGTEFGIQVSGTGSEWFTAPAPLPDGLYLGGYGRDDANPDIGDSAITETAGLGGFAIAAAPAIVQFVGGDVADAVATTLNMYEITLAEHPGQRIPALDFRGSPTGIDVTRVLRTGILPVITTGIAGRIAGTGQVGAGLVQAPAECFTKALARLAGLVPRA